MSAFAKCVLTLFFIVFFTLFNLIEKRDLEFEFPLQHRLACVCVCMYVWRIPTPIT